MNKPTKIQKFAEVVWTAEDVIALAPKMTEEEAEQWLDENEKHIRDRLIEEGWELISALLDQKKYDDDNE